jgi:hypothetical protein
VLEDALRVGTHITHSDRVVEFGTTRWVKHAVDTRTQFIERTEQARSTPAH